jgi:phenylacetic acid degradation operon negative regulatory protein
MVLTVARIPDLQSRISTIELWIRRTLTVDPPRAKSLAVSIFGDAIAPHGGCIRLQGLIELLRPFAINERLVRTSVFRLVKEDWLEANRNGRESSYELTESGRRRLNYAYARVYTRAPEPWNGNWTLILVRSDELSPERRQQLRQELEWEGVRQLAPHLYGHPRIQAGALAELLARVGVRQQVVSFCNATANHIGSGDFQDLVKERWNLANVVKHYEKFLKNFRRARELLGKGEDLSPSQWFAIRIIMLHTFRRVVLQDPLLPEELLPKPWIGNEAYQLAGDIYRLSLPGSEVHLKQVCEFEGEKAGGGRRILKDRFR